MFWWSKKFEWFLKCMKFVSGAANRDFRTCGLLSEFGSSVSSKSIVLASRTCLYNSLEVQICRALRLCVLSLSCKLVSSLVCVCAFVLLCVSSHVCAVKCVCALACVPSHVGAFVCGFICVFSPSCSRVLLWERSSCLWRVPHAQVAFQPAHGQTKARACKRHGSLFSQPVSPARCCRAM